LVFLDDDDVLTPRGLDAVRECVEVAPAQVGMVFTAVLMRRQRGGPEQIVEAVDLGPVFGGVRGQLVAGGFCINRKVMTAIGGYDESLRFAENTELILRAIEHCIANRMAVLTIDAPLGSIWRRGPHERSSNQAAALKQAAERILSVHAGAFARDRRTAADFHRIAGVNSARIGRRREAARHFDQAFTLGRSRVDLIRALVARLPGVWRLAWTSRQADPLPQHEDAVVGFIRR
jgi:hypothetical protein